MNKEITIYELLGLIKDGKAPKKIKYNNRTYEFKEIEEGTGYVYESGIVKFWLSNEIEFDISRCLNEKVEILEEDKPIIEKLNIESDSPTHFYIRNEYGTKCSLTKHSKMIADKLNEIIEFLNNKFNH